MTSALAAYWAKGRNKPVSRRRILALARLYALEWALTITCWGCFYALDRVDGFRREFDINDTSLQHTYATDSTVSATNLYLIALLLPAVVILAFSIGWERSVWDWNVGWLGLALSLAVTNTATNIVKITVGRPRPDILDRCQPPVGASNPALGLSTSAICTRTDLLKDGFRSFPSGHASLSACGMVYLTLYLAGKMRVWDHKGLSLKSWILLAPLSIAALVAISRLCDYRHHPTDVLAGSLLGTCIGSYTYSLYYQPISGPRAGRPYSPRIARESTDGEDEGSETDEEARLGEPGGPTKAVGSSDEGVESVELQRGLLTRRSADDVDGSEAAGFA